MPECEQVPPLVYPPPARAEFDPVTGRSENAFGAVNPASRWIELVPGENRIGMTLSEEASRATMTITWYNRYLGA